MIRTRVGYAGGSKENPTYHSLGNHSETIQIDYDPTRISYRQLLGVFWSSHSPIYEPGSRQYMSVVFYHSEEQQRLAIDMKESEEARLGRDIFTEIVPFKEFYLAEDYHQKYYLRQEPALMQDFKAIYPATKDFIASTAVARVNGYAGGYGESATLEEELKILGLSESGRKRLLEISARGLEPICPLPYTPS